MAAFLRRVAGLADCVYPLYHVFAGVAPFAGGSAAAFAATDDLVACGLALLTADRQAVLVASLTIRPRRALVRSLPVEVGVRLLDETNVWQAMSEPETWRAAPSVRQSTSGGVLTLELRPYPVGYVEG